MIKKGIEIRRKHLSLNFNAEDYRSVKNLSLKYDEKNYRNPKKTSLIKILTKKTLARNMKKHLSWRKLRIRFTPTRKPANAPSNYDDDEKTQRFF